MTDSKIEEVQQLRYRTTDGQLFDCRYPALEHQAAIALDKALELGGYSDAEDIAERIVQKRMEIVAILSALP